MEFDSAKNDSNFAKHGFYFEQVSELDWECSVTRSSFDPVYGEERFITYAPLKGRICTLVWTERNGTLRPISFRKANARERKRYEKEKTL